MHEHMASGRVGRRHEVSGFNESRVFAASPHKVPAYTDRLKMEHDMKQEMAMKPKDRDRIELQRQMAARAAAAQAKAQAQAQAQQETPKAPAVEEAKAPSTSWGLPSSLPWSPNTMMIVGAVIAAAVIAAYFYYQSSQGDSPSGGQQFASGVKASKPFQALTRPPPPRGL